ncbi:MAG: hypothetical protein PHF00_13915, partial [Elusimicrobia bacterium]|nr:hypothetical protein [Elusimicrobiota bacterium]
MSRFWLLAALAAAAPAGSADPARSARREVEAVFAGISQRLSLQAGRDARAVAAGDREIESLSPAILKWGWRATEPLAAVLRDRARPDKERLYALIFMSRIRDP